MRGNGSELTDVNREKFDQMYGSAIVAGSTIENIDFNFIYDFNKEKDIENLTFENIAFINCVFQFVGILDCVFVNCKFIKVHFYDDHIYNNKFIDCDFENVTFFNNLEFSGNLLERVTGYIGYYSANQCEGNIFKDMDFSGFLPFYVSMHDSSMVWRRNYFINSYILVDALEKLSEKATGIYPDKGYYNAGYLRRFLSRTTDVNAITMEGIGYRFEYPYERELPDIDDIEGIPLTGVRLDLSNVDNVTKLNVISSIFTKYLTGHLLFAKEDNKITDMSYYEEHTIPNPRPARIVDSRGYVLNSGVIQDINVGSKEFIQAYGGMFLHDLSSSISHSYGEDSNLKNPDNYSCRALVRRQ